MTYEYLTFPVCIFSNYKGDLKPILNDAMEYCLFETSLKFKGTEKENMEEASKVIGIRFPNPKESFKNGMDQYYSIPTNSPKTSIAKKTIFDFYQNAKTAFEIISFITFAAMRSILQTQPYVKITNEYLIGRMAGNSRTGKELPEWLHQYNNRYQLEKIKTELQLKWGLKLYGNHTRGFYISFTMPLESLIRQAELKRKKYKEKELRSAKNEALKSVLNDIDRTTQTQHIYNNYKKGASKEYSK